MLLTEWSQRFNLLNRYLPYFLDVAKMKKVSDNKVKDLKSLWTYGGFTRQDKRSILLNIAPQNCLMA